jgi:hypothetical protein
LELIAEFSITTLAREDDIAPHLEALKNKKIIFLEKILPFEFMEHFRFTTDKNKLSLCLTDILSWIIDELMFTKLSVKRKAAPSVAVLPTQTELMNVTESVRYWVATTPPLRQNSD